MSCESIKVFIERQTAINAVANPQLVKNAILRPLIIEGALSFYKEGLQGYKIPARDVERNSTSIRTCLTQRNGVLEFARNYCPPTKSAEAVLYTASIRK